MTSIELLNKITDDAKKYSRTGIESIRRNSHMHKLGANTALSQEVVNAVLVDFINYMASKRCVDYGLYSIDIEKFNLE